MTIRAPAATAATPKVAASSPAARNINPALTVAQTQVSTVSGFMDIINSTVSCNFAKGGDGGAGANSTDGTGGEGGDGGLAQGGGIYTNFIPEDGNEPISPTLVAGEFINVVNSSVCSNTAKGGNGGNGGNGDDGGDGGDGGYAEGGGVLRRNAMPTSIAPRSRSTRS